LIGRGEGVAASFGSCVRNAREHLAHGSTESQGSMILEDEAGARDRADSLARELSLASCIVRRSMSPQPNVMFDFIGTARPKCRARASNSRCCNLSKLSFGCRKF
jgi:hypothetical protein